MAIICITGLPGHGKTLYTLTRFRDVAAKEGRPVYYSGIKGLKLPWAEWEPEKWQELPPTAIFIVDEAQFKFPLRGRGEPPEWIARLAVHRHQGVDLVLITQNPMLLDSFVRRLVDQHFHVVRKFGTQFATIYESASGVNEQVAKSRGGMIPHEWRYPKDVFELYHSAEVHTVKRRIPARVWLFLALPFVLGGLVWFLYGRLQPDAVASRTTGAAPGASSSASVPGGVRARGLAPGRAGAPGMDAVAYVDAHRPRVADLAYTAPVYDSVTQPVQAPYPAACVASASRCACYTQQATRLEVSDELCRRIAAGGFFVAWATSGAPVDRRPELLADAGGAGGPAGFSTSYRGPGSPPSPSPGAAARSGGSVGVPARGR